MSSLRVLKFHLETAGKLYEEMKASSHPVDRALGHFFHQHRRRYGSNDRKMISEILYGIFRHRLLIESWMKELAKTSGPFYGGKATPSLLALAVEGLIDKEVFSAFFGDKFKKEGENLYQALVQKEVPSGAHPNTFEEILSFRYSFPLWMVKRWIGKFGNEVCEKLLRAMNERPPLVLRANPLRVSRDKLVRILNEKGHESQATALSPCGVKVLERFNVFEMKEFKEGFFEIQDEGSQLVALAVNPQPGEVVWDACAGGGGKTLLLAALMKNKGRVIATDIRQKKLSDLKKRAKRAGIFNIFPADLERLDRSSLFKRGMDKILIDAPCSGTGTLRRNPDAKWKISPEKLAEHQRDQLKILDNYMSYLKPGGTLVYATCSLEPEENEEMIEIFLKAHSEFSRSEADRHLYPHTDGTDGFFISRLLQSSR